jgi:hypothetical protein
MWGKDLDNRGTPTLIGPSWSWVSLDGSIYFLDHGATLLASFEGVEFTDALSYQLTYPVCRSNSKTPPTHIPALAVTYTIHFMDWSETRIIQTKIDLRSGPKFRSCFSLLGIVLV